LNKQQRIAKAGKLLCVDRGEYSDYEVIGLFVVLRDFNPRAELGEYLAANPDDIIDHCEYGVEIHRFNEDAYFAVLLAKGLLMKVEYGTLYLGSYSNLKSFNFVPAR
jgi:hypothetical protein